METPAPPRRARSPLSRRVRPRISPVAVPSFFTLMNLLSGFFALISATNGNFAAAAWLVILAGFFDLLDGMMARLTRSASAFGVQLDSLADVVSFGVAPGIILYEFGLDQLGLPGVVVAALPAICGAIRLARFNVRFDGEKKSYFEGLPIPAQAATVVVFILVFDDASWFEALERGRLSILVPLVVFLSTLMVSTVPFEAVPAPTPRFFRANPRKGLAFLVAFAVVLLFQEEGIFAVLVAYLLWGVGRAVYAVTRAAVTAPDPAATAPDPAAAPGDPSTPDP